MRWGIAFRIPYADESRLANFPKPTLKYIAYTGNGRSKYLSVVYMFRFAPQSWRQLQQVGRIKVLMHRFIPSIIFDETVGVEQYDSDELDLGTAYTVAELGRHFTGFVRIPSPLYPQGKEELLSRLAMYAKRLFYGHMLHMELVFAMAIHFNEKLGQPFNRKQVQSKTLSVMKMSKTGWKEKLGSKSLRQAHRTGGEKRGTQQMLEAQQRCLKIKDFIPNCLKDNGKPDVTALMKATSLSRSTVYSYLRKIDTGEV